jgi:MATE family multidrug resistance protein
MLISILYFSFGRNFIAFLTNQPSTRELAMRYLPWAAALPLISFWGFQLDGIFIGATRTAALRNSMLLSAAGFLVLSIVLQHRLGNSGLWLAFSLFMALRGITLTLCLRGITQSFRNEAER